MAYQVTARKWRPMRFSDMVGQEHIARTLRNAIITDRIAHAYLFVGPRGIGKTTSARIFAKALNCKSPIDGEPCCKCDSCKSIADESNVDIIEIDAATHTQVDKAREICEDVLHLPISSKYKIYIIDEVHMLSKSAWNALLKTIEEPPAHAKFIFATTEVNKVLPTVISRCQRFDLKRIPSDLITKRLAYIAGEENIRISVPALNVIARAADGGMRDAQSLLDQLVSFFGTDPANEITEEQALSLFGMTSPSEMVDLIRSILDDNRKDVVLYIHRFAQQGKNLESLYEEVLTWLRGIMLSLILPDPETVLDENPERLADYKELAEGRKPNIIQTLLEKLSESGYLLREAINKQVFIETIMLKSMRAAHSIPIESLIVRLNQIRRTGELAGIEKVPALAAVPVSAVPFSAGEKVTAAPIPAEEEKKNSENAGIKEEGKQEKEPAETAVPQQSEQELSSPVPQVREEQISPVAKEKAEEKIPEEKVEKVQVVPEIKEENIPEEKVSAPEKSEEKIPEEKVSEDHLLKISLKKKIFLLKHCRRKRRKPLRKLIRHRKRQKRKKMRKSLFLPIQRIRKKSGNILLFLQERIKRSHWRNSCFLAFPREWKAWNLSSPSIRNTGKLPLLRFVQRSIISWKNWQRSPALQNLNLSVFPVSVPIREQPGKRLWMT